MSEENQIHTGAGVELVRRLANQGDNIFTTAQARKLGPSVGLSNGYIRQSLHHLAKAGWIVRLHKGLYAVSSTVPGVSPSHEFEIAMSLVKPAAISHWSALHYHGLTEQVLRKVFVLTTSETSVPKISGKNGYPIGETIYQFIQIKPERFFGTQKVWVGKARVCITNLERTLIDGLTMPQYCGDFSEVLHAFESSRDKLNLKQILNYALRLDVATVKRLGWVLEQQGIAAKHLAPLKRVSIKGYRTLDANGPRQGPCNSHWGIQENLPGKIKS